MKVLLSFFTTLSCLVFLACSQQNIDQVLFETAVGDYDIIVTGEGVLEAKNAQVLMTPRVRAMPTISYLVPEGDNVTKGDTVVIFTATTIENNYLAAIDEVASAKAEAAQKEAELSLQMLMYESQYLTASASAKSAQLQLDKLAFEQPKTREIKKLEIDQYQLEAERARNNLESLENIQKEERAHSAMKIRQAENKLNRAKEQLDQLVLLAPGDGIVVYSENFITGEKVSEGANLYRGMPVVKLPDLALMQVVMKIGETDAQKLEMGMPAIVTIPSLDDVEFTGKVSRVDRMAKPIRRGSKVKKVEVVVEMDSSANALRPGMTAVADIIIQKATNVMALPHETIFNKDSLKIVYIQNKEQYEPMPVAGLLQDDDFSIIYGNLTGGEKLALREPPNTRVNWPDSFSAPQVPAEADTFKIEKNEPDMPTGIPPELLKNMPPGAQVNIQGQ